MISSITAAEITRATAATATSAAITNDFMNYSVILVVALILAMVTKEILRSDAKINTKISYFIDGSNVAIIPLISIFVFVLAYKMFIV
jgi:hypothetical protein